MTQFLPPNLLALFAARDPIPYLPPPDKLPHEKKNVHVYEGVAQYITSNFEEPSETPPPTRVEMREERLERKKRDKEEQVAYKLEQEIALWDPTAVDEATSDPYKTLYVGRISYYTSESKIRREFESHGPIKTIRMIHDKNSGKPRGYCFIEFEHEKDMHSAYKHADGKKLDGKRVLVDVERARTVRGWLPRRLGGGLGGTRRGGPDVNVRHSGREDGGGAGGGGRDRDRDDRRRSRSRERDRDRDRRRRRSRSRDRDRKRRRSRSRDRRRSRSWERKKIIRRSRSRERERDKERDRGRRDKDRERRGRGVEEGQEAWPPVQVKEEPVDEADYADGGGGGGGDASPYDAQIKQEQDDVDRKPQIVDNGYYDSGY